MNPIKLKIHLHIKHSHLCEKPTEYFKRLVANQTRQAQQWTKITLISDKAQEVNNAVAEILTKYIKIHPIPESVILLACCKILNNFNNNFNILGNEYEKEVSKVPMSDNTISRRIQDMSEDVESQGMD
jgi:hypothetical protein